MNSSIVVRSLASILNYEHFTFSLLILNANFSRFVLSLSLSLACPPPEG